MADARSLNNTVANIEELTKVLDKVRPNLSLQMQEENGNVIEIELKDIEYATHIYDKDLAPLASLISAVEVYVSNLRKLENEEIARRRKTWQLKAKENTGIATVRAVKNRRSEEAKGNIDNFNQRVKNTLSSPLHKLQKRTTSDSPGPSTPDKGSPHVGSVTNSGKSNPDDSGLDDGPQTPASGVQSTNSVVQSPSMQITSNISSLMQLSKDLFGKK